MTKAESIMKFDKLTVRINTVLCQVLINVSIHVETLLKIEISHALITSMTFLVFAR